VFRVQLTRKVLKDFERIALHDLKTARIIKTHLEKLPHCFRQDEFLKGPFSHLKKHRVGDWRIIYEVINQDLVILVIRLGHRREVYD
jgi:mRNA interferase RelE/StbE